MHSLISKYVEPTAPHLQGLSNAELVRVQLKAPHRAAGPTSRGARGQSPCAGDKTWVGGSATRRGAYLPPGHLPCLHFARGRFALKVTFCT
jgi:hypothetical protein